MFGRDNRRWSSREQASERVIVSRPRVRLLLSRLKEAEVLGGLREEASAPLFKVERFDWRPIEPFELLHIRIPENSVRIQKQFSKFLQKFWKFEDFSTFCHFLECSAKSREKIIKIWPEFDENCRKIMIFCRNSNKNSREVWRIFASILNWERCEGVWILMILKNAKNLVFGCKNRLRCRRERTL